MSVSRVCRCLFLGVAFCWLLPLHVRAQASNDLSRNSQLSASDTAALLPNPARSAELQAALGSKDYKTAETILLDEANRDPHSPRAAKILALAGGVFFLDGAYLDSVTAWQKSEAIVPLDERSRFTLAMAYVKLHRVKPARVELEKLADAQPQSALYLYWLARLDYDGQQYTDAILRLQQVTNLDPKMTRAYNLLGLCYDYQGHLDKAILAFGRAVDLNRTEPKPSPWPNLDMANSQIELNQLPEAEKNLQEAIAYDPQLPKAQYDLGRVLEKQGRYKDAVQALKRAAALDASYAEPHYLLGRIYQRLGETDLAKTEIEQFQHLGNTHCADKTPIN